LEDYKLIIVKNAKSNDIKGAKVLSKLLGFAPQKCMGIIKMMPVTLFEAKNFAIAKKLKNLMAPLESCGFALLITLDSGNISKINWPDGMKLVGTLLSKIKESVPEHANLINHCPSCGDEIRYHINLRIEHEQHKLPLDIFDSQKTTIPILESEENLIEPEEIMEDEEIEDLVEMEEITNNEVNENPQVDNEESSEFAEVISQDNISIDEFEELEGGIELQSAEADDTNGENIKNDNNLNQEMDSYGEFGQEFDDENYSLGDDFGVDEEDYYNIELCGVAKRREKLQIYKILNSLLDLNEDEAKIRVQGKGSVLISEISLDDARYFKEAFDKKNINVKITN